MGRFLVDLAATREGGHAANGEALTSKEKLQSRNDELNALNSQLQEALERQRTTSNDLLRFLATASHDLRQPLQTLALLQGLLVKAVENERGRSLIGRLGQTLGTLSGMLDTMLDINQIDAGAVQPKPVDFVVGELIQRVRDEFADQAEAKNLKLRIVPCMRVVHGDPLIIEQMLRNLIANALKYTKCGKILLGCRQQGDTLRIQVGDTGVGIAATDFEAIFDEYYQVGNTARERTLGLGLGLSIVRRLGDLANHRVSVQSLVGRGSIFSIELSLPNRALPGGGGTPAVEMTSAPKYRDARTGTILIVDDESEVRELLDKFLSGEGHSTATAANGKAALALIAGGAVVPDLLLADYNLSEGMNGLELGLTVRNAVRRPLPVIILTGDISTSTMREVAAHECAQLNKPVKLETLTHIIQRLLPSRKQRPQPPIIGTAPTIYIVDDDKSVRDGLRELLERDGRIVESFADCETFLAAYRPGGEACLLVDAYLPSINGIDLLRQLKAEGHHLPAIMITGSSDVPMAVEAMKAGAIDFIEKPVACDELLASIDRAFVVSRDAAKVPEWRATAAMNLAGLTARQQQILDLVLAGHPSKNIAADLHISQRTVENHRAAIMSRTGAKSLPALARLAVAAAER